MLTVIHQVAIISSCGSWPIKKPILVLPLGRVSGIPDERQLMHEDLTYALPTEDKSLPCGNRRKQP
jgi:hypothetical protein